MRIPCTNFVASQLVQLATRDLSRREPSESFRQSVGHRTVDDGFPGRNIVVLVSNLFCVTCGQQNIVCHFHFPRTSQARRFSGAGLWQFCSWRRSQIRFAHAASAACAGTGMTAIQNNRNAGGVLSQFVDQCAEFPVANVEDVSLTTVVGDDGLIKAAGFCLRNVAVQ